MQRGTHHIIPSLVIRFSILGLGTKLPGPIILLLLGRPKLPALGPPGPAGRPRGDDADGVDPFRPPPPVIQGCWTRRHASFSQYALPPTSK